jgi:hypothetical protein
MEWFSSYGEDAEKAIKRLLGKKPSKPKGLFAFLTPGIDPEEARKSFSQAFLGVPLIGCTATGTFTDEAVSGAPVSLALLCGEDVEVRTGIAGGVNADPVFSLDSIDAQLKKKSQSNFDPVAVVLLADGFTKKGSDLALAASEIFQVLVAGGLAGDIFTMHETYVFTEDRTVAAAVAAAMIYAKSAPSLGLAHGHKPISELMEITKADGNVVLELSGKPALQAWRNLGLIPENTPPEAIVKTLVRYELGIQIGRNYAVRYPAGVNPDGSVAFLTEIPEHTPCRILGASKDQQIEAAESSARQALEGAGRKPSGALVFDCAVRLMSLGDDFPKAVERVRDVLQAPFAGFETSGEIAFLPGYTEGFHNTTTVTLAFPATED